MPPAKKKTVAKKTKAKSKPRATARARKPKPDGHQIRVEPLGGEWKWVVRYLPTDHPEDVEYWQRSGVKPTRADAEAIAKDTVVWHREVLAAEADEEAAWVDA